VATSFGTVNVTSTKAAVGVAGPTSVRVKNTGSQVVYIGLAASQTYPLASGESETFTLLAAEVLNVATEYGTGQISYSYSTA
jgi:hypothetical protein